MKIFLTGGTGFIGSCLLNLLGQSIHEVLVLVRPQSAVQHPPNPRIQLITGTLNDVVSYQSALDHFQPEGCIHLAWYTNPADYLTAEDANLSQLEASLQLLRTLKRVRCRRFVAAGTCVGMRYRHQNNLGKRARPGPQPFTPQPNSLSTISASGSV